MRSIDLADLADNTVDRSSLSQHIVVRIEGRNTATTVAEAFESPAEYGSSERLPAVREYGQDLINVLRQQRKPFRIIRRLAVLADAPPVSSSSAFFFLSA